MTKHLGYALMGGILFLGVTLLNLKFLDKGIHDGLLMALSESEVFQSIVKASFWIGVFSGGVSSMVLRKSTNRTTYIWIALIFTLIFTEFVISTIY